MAETITKMLPTRRVSMIDLIFTNCRIAGGIAPRGMTQEVYSNSEFVRPDMEIAIKAYGKYTPMQARDLLMAGVEDFSSKVVLISRIDNADDALFLLRSRKFEGGEFDQGSLRRALWVIVDNALGDTESRRIGREIAGY